MKKALLLKPMLLLFALIVGIGSTWGQTYDKLTSIANIDGSADYVLGIDGTGFHYSGTSGWGLTALPSAQTPIYYTLTKNSNNDGFTAQATISNTTYYLTVPTSKTFTMSTSSTEIGMGTNGEIVNKSSTSWMIRRNGDSGLRAYSTSTGDVAYFYKVIPVFSLTAVSNNTSWGTVSVSGNKITANPSTGYRVSTTTPYTVTSGSATVVQNNNEFTVTANAACTVCINFEAIPTYTVTFNAEGGSCGTSSLTESLGGQGVTLPAATISVAGWVFAGWAESTVTQTTTIPTLYVAGSKYYPTAATTLHAVYTLSATGTTYTRLTSLNQINAAKKIAVASTYGSKILTHDASVVSAPSESSGEITVTSSQIFELSGNNTTGFVLTGSSGTLSQPTMPTSGSSNNEKPIGWDGTNNKWIIEENTYATNVFAVRNANSTQVALEYDSGWKSYYVSTYTSSQYTAMKLYLPKTAYNSNPSAITEPSVAFDNGNNGTTLYLDGTKTYTNAANVTGVTKPITYSSSDTNVAEVDATGKVTAKAIGTATITASVEAELGVSAPASATYVITVKSATTLAGIKAQATSSTPVDFTADLANDLVITYVNGSHAYLQSGNVAVYASCAGEGWEAGKKFSGAISGKVRKYYNEYQITAIDQVPVFGGVVPESVVVSIGDLSVDNYATYEGRKVVINGATISTAMANTATSGGVITDGTNTLNINAPEKGITLVLNEKGNFNGYVGRYNNGIRLYMYDPSWFVKTHNAPTAQTLTFDEDAVELDEDTEAYENFTPQTVSGAQGTVTYAIEGDDIYENFNTTNGTFTLKAGSYGTATITATAAAANVTESGVITPYTETTKSYTVSVYPRYTSTFVINGIESQVRQATHGAAITVPTPATIGDYYFKGWKANSAIAEPTNDAPEMVTPPTTPTENLTYYAVFALGTPGGEEQITSTFTIKTSNAPSSGCVIDGVTWSYSNITFANTASAGMPNGATLSFSMPDNAIKAVSIAITKTSNEWSSTKVSLPLTDKTNTLLETFNSSTLSYQFVNTYNNSDPYKITANNTDSKVAYIDHVDFIYAVVGVIYSNYCTTVPAPASVTAKIASSGFTTLSSFYPLDFSNVDNLEAAYVISELSSTKATFAEVTSVPAETGVVLKGTAGETITIPVATGTPTAPANNYLKAAVVDTQVESGTTYGLSGGIWKLYTGTLIPAGKAYLLVSDVPGNSPSLSFDFGDGTTGVVDVNRATINDNQYYTLDGRRVENPSNGIYIVNGKKVVVK